MTRASGWLCSGLVGCVAIAVGATGVSLFLHATGVSFRLTDSYFIVGPALAQESMGTMAKPAAAPSTSLTVTFNGKTTIFSVADLTSMPQKTLKVHNEHTKADEIYTGPALGDVLAKAGFTVNQTTHHEMLRSYVQAAGTDKYWVLYSLTEVEPSEHEGDIIVATGMNGGGLGADGQFKLVSGEDKKPQRWVRNLAAITVKAAE